MSPQWQPGKLVTLRGREWVVLPSDDVDLLVVKPLGGSEDEVAGIYLPLGIAADEPRDARFAPPTAEDLGDLTTARHLLDAARLAFRNGAGPFRALAKLSFRPHAYQIVPLIMALRQEQVRLLIADDVGVGKTVEALLIVRELLERRKIRRFAVICLPHLCDQWQEEIRSKLDIEAVVIRSNTQARLDRQIQGDTSVYEFYPHQIISVDYIKSDVRRDLFVQQAPELVIVDEAHTCARPSGAAVSQQQRYHLLRRLSDKADQQLVLLTATPHSGKPEEFQSLLGLLRPDYETLDLAEATATQRREVAAHFIQRKRADVAQWRSGERTPFPQRDSIEWPYDLAPDYAGFFQDILAFARRLVTPDPADPRKVRRVQFWTALALLRGVMSSPAAGVAMLGARLANLAAAVGEDVGAGPADEILANPVGDADDPTLGDSAPTQVLEQADWSDTQRRQLRDFARRLEGLAGPAQDQKLASLALILEDWLDAGFHPVVFCRYIATATYLGEQLTTILGRKHKDAEIQVVTSEDPDDVRRQRIQGMRKSRKRILIATDCLSEGINLQDAFTAVLHYDLPWNPNRLEQREGRVDRFGQTAEVVKTCLLYGNDNPIDGIVLEVLLRKVKEIRRATGISVAFPEDSQSIIDSITHALLLSPEQPAPARTRVKQESLFAAQDLQEAKEAEKRVSRMLEEAAQRQQISRDIFAQNAIKAEEIEQDLVAVDEAIGDPDAVRGFVCGALQEVLGVQLTPDRRAAGFHLVMANLPPQFADLLPAGAEVPVSFVSPTPRGFHYLGRNHPFVEQLCQLLMANTLARTAPRAARAAVVRTRAVTRKTTLLLFRCRNVIEEGRTRHQIVAEEMRLWGWRGVPGQQDHLSHEEARALLREVRASSNLSSEARRAFLENELTQLDGLGGEFDAIAEEQSRELVRAHERFSSLLDKKRFQVVYPVLPMDILGVYVLLPEDAA
jgi:superfamily II DNA or RNA helicase